MRVVAVVVVFTETTRLHGSSPLRVFFISFYNLPVVCSVLPGSNPVSAADVFVVRCVRVICVVVFCFYACTGVGE